MRTVVIAGLASGLLATGCAGASRLLGHRTRAEELRAANALATATESAASAFAVTFSEITASLAK